MVEDLDIIAIEAENGSERGKSLQIHQNERGEKIEVRRKKIDAVIIYDVTEAELTLLEKGSETSVWLNFLIGSISIAVSFLVSLLNVDLGNTISITQIVFICVTIIMFIAAVVCFVFWRRGQGQHKVTIKAIRERTLQENC